MSRPCHGWRRLPWGERGRGAGLEPEHHLRRASPTSRPKTRVCATRGPRPGCEAHPGRQHCRPRTAAGVSGSQDPAPCRCARCHQRERLGKHKALGGETGSATFVASGEEQDEAEEGGRVLGWGNYATTHRTTGSTPAKCSWCCPKDEGLPTVRRQLTIGAAFLGPHGAEQLREGGQEHAARLRTLLGREDLLLDLPVLAGDVDPPHPRARSVAAQPARAAAVTRTGKLRGR
jgi:hypothetical protein